MDKLRRRSRLLPSNQKALIVQFVAGVPVRTAAELVGVNRNTAILFFHKLREVIVENVAKEAPFPWMSQSFTRCVHRIEQTRGGLMGLTPSRYGNRKNGSGVIAKRAW